MVRVFIKGGVWKNSEDEILKAAVMKYGKQQWARVASLLNRKSAKQCKARWNEWLDPSIRKVEWSRAEDEKLLHLAKLMPAQWKTIGPLVGGRTAVQSQERYEMLLDQAASATAAASAGEDAEGGEAEGVASSARKLRAGDIDPHPETKPARPDPIDMDEDEIEMLQEARARLANTQGKKAKRKAREKMLNEAKRLADLQKRRELKQAGLLSSAARTKMRGGKKRRRQIDYGVEIPFHKPAPAGFHSTAEEDERADVQRSKRLKEIDFKKVNEAQYRARDREQKNAQKKEEARLRALEKSNMQYVVAEVSKKNDPIAARKRGVLSMPAPSVTDEELEKVAKLTKEQRADHSAISTSGGTGGVTDALLGDYTDRPLPTPMRTPMGAGAGASGQEVIMREASNLRMLEQGQTPLLGGDNPDLIAGGAGTGVELNQGQNQYATAGAATPMIGGSATPMTVSGGRSTANQTPMTASNRDELGLNSNTGMDVNDDVSISATSFATTVGDRSVSMSIKEIARAERRAAKRARKELEMALANLPAPQFEYELAAPDAVTDDDDGDENNNRMFLEKDAAELEAEEMARLEKEAADSYAKRSSVVKRVDLPRPIGNVDETLILDDDDDVDGDDDADTNASLGAHKLINDEVLVLLQHDAFTHPYTRIEEEVDGGVGVGGKKSKKDKKKRKKAAAAADSSPVNPPEKALDYFEEGALDAAKSLLEEEYESVIQEKRRIVAGTGTEFETDEDVKNLLNKETISKSISSGAATDGGGLASSLPKEFYAIQESIEAMRKRTDKLESKLAIKNGGYIKRSVAMQESLSNDFGDLQNSAIEEFVFSSLMEHERRGMAQRVEKLQEETEYLEQTETFLQKQYGNLLHERNRHKLLIRQKEGQTEKA